MNVQVLQDIAEARKRAAELGRRARVYVSQGEPISARAFAEAAASFANIAREMADEAGIASCYSPSPPGVVVISGDPEGAKG